MPQRQVEDLAHVNLKMPPALVKKTEDWRSRQRPIPNLSEAIRRLIAERLKDGAR
jgi:hypothetical protein